VLVVRTDLGMTKGKIAAQYVLCVHQHIWLSHVGYDLMQMRVGALVYEGMLKALTPRLSHATLACYKAIQNGNPTVCTSSRRESSGIKMSLTLLNCTFAAFTTLGVDWTGEDCFAG
jgi:hypothetical protein